MASNAAAWLTEAKSKVFQVKPAEMWTAGEGEILVRNKACAINPVDGALQAFAFFPLEYPTILGQDVAGDVVATGTGVTRFSKGDRVVGHAVGMSTKRLQDNAFQAYTILNAHMASPIPAELSYERAAVIPLGLSTAACGLFQDKPYLGLELPKEPRGSATGYVLVWGGASSVGSNGIQLAVAAGYQVITTASPKNFDYVKELGASEAFDYRGPSVEADLLKALEGKTLAGVLDCIGGDAFVTCCNVAAKADGAAGVATTKGGPKDFAVPEGITTARIFGTTLKDNAIGKAIYEDYLPKALAAGTFVPAPAPEVVGQGLDAVQGAVDTIMKGVSAKKLVVSL